MVNKDYQKSYCCSFGTWQPSMVMIQPKIGLLALYAHACDDFRGSYIGEGYSCFFPRVQKPGFQTHDGCVSDNCACVSIRASSWSRDSVVYGYRALYVKLFSVLIVHCIFLMANKDYNCSPFRGSNSPTKKTILVLEAWIGVYEAPKLQRSYISKLLHWS